MSLIALIVQKKIIHLSSSYSWKICISDVELPKPIVWSAQKGVYVGQIIVQIDKYEFKPLQFWALFTIFMLPSDLWSI